MIKSYVKKKKKHANTHSHTHHLLLLAVLQHFRSEPMLQQRKKITKKAERKQQTRL